MVDKIFDNLEVLMGGQEDMLQAKQALAELKEGLGDGYMGYEPLITGTLSEYERQGFIRGFQMAVSLFINI